VIADNFLLRVEGEKPALGMSFALLTNLDFNPLKSMKAQMLVAARLGESLKMALRLLTEAMKGTNGSEELERLETRRAAPATRTQSRSPSMREMVDALVAEYEASEDEASGVESLRHLLADLKMLLQRDFSRERGLTPDDCRLVIECSKAAGWDSEDDSERELHEHLARVAIEVARKWSAAGGAVVRDMRMHDVVAGGMSERDRSEYLDSLERARAQAETAMVMFIKAHRLR
jgi:hypothetical protein